MKQILILVLMVVVSFTVKAQRYGNFDAVNLRPVLESEAGVIYPGKFYYDKTCNCFKFREGTAWVKLIKDGDKGDITVSVDGTVFDLDAGVITSTDLADNAVTNTKIADNAVTTVKINNSAVTGSKIAPATVTYSDIQNLDALSVLGNPTNVSGVSSSIAAVTEGHVLRLVGTTLGFGTVTTAGLTNNSVTSDKINDGTIATIDLADLAVTTAKINNNAVTGAQINDGAVGTLDLADLAVTTAKINNNAVTSAQINDGSVSNADLTNSSISFATGTTGTDVNWTASPVSLGGTATLNIPSATASARGVVTTTTQTFAGAKTFTGNVKSVSVLIGNPSIGSGTINGITTDDPITGLSVYNRDGDATTVTPNIMTIYGGSAYSVGNNKGGSVGIHGGNGNGTGVGGDIILDVEPSNATADGKLILNGINADNSVNNLLAINGSNEVVFRSNVTLASGTYTPTFTNVVNVDASTSFVWNYMRVGSVVTISGRINVDATTANTGTQVRFTLPIASNFGSTDQMGGVMATNVNAGYGYIHCDTVNDQGLFDFTPTSNVNLSYNFTCTYLIQ